MYLRKFKVPNESFFLLGARGTGKTSLLEAQLKASLSIELLSQENYFKYASEPGLLRRQIEILEPNSWVWIDEIQRIPDLLNEVHWGIEKKKLKFALSGSSARKMRKAGVNLLAGRALSKILFPFVPAELGDDFSLDTALQFGSIPLIFVSENRKEKLRAYVHSYLKEEVQQEALVKDVPNFTRFLKVSSLLHAQTLSLSSVARDAGVKRTTIDNYFSILEDTLLAYRLMPYESGTRVKERHHPKFYWLDCGWVRALREDWGPIHPNDKGPLFEGLILTLLRAYQSYIDLFDEIYYWGTPNVEVDFLLKKDSNFYAIEVKTSTRTRPEDFIGLKAIADMPRLKRRIIVYPEIDLQKTSEGIEILNFSEFNKQLESGELTSAKRVLDKARE